MTNLDIPAMIPLPQEQEAPKSKSTAIIVAIVSVFLIAAIITFIVLFIKNNDKTAESEPSPTPTQSATTSEPTPTAAPDDTPKYPNGGITLGKDLVAGTENTGATRVDIYFDYTCGYCELLLDEFDTALSDATKAGNITLVYHPILVHQNNPFAYTGAGAEHFIASNEPEKYLTFHALMHEKITAPYMNGEISEPAVQDIVQIAREAGLSEENCTTLSNELTQLENYVLSDNPPEASALLRLIIDETNQFIDNGGTGTPTVIIDGIAAENWRTDLADLLNK